MTQRNPARPALGRAPTALVEAFQRAVAGMSGITMRPMFGYPAAFVTDRMFAGLFQDFLVLRLSADDAWLARAEAYARTLPAKPKKPSKR